MTARLFSVVLSVGVLLLVAPIGAAAPVSASAASTTSTAAPVEQLGDDPGEPVPPDDSGGAGGGGDGGAGGGDERSVVEVLLNPVETAEEVVGWAVGRTVTHAESAVASGIDYIATVISGMPAPGTIDEPSSWLTPDDGLWPAVYEAWTYTFALSLVLTGTALTVAFRHTDRYERRRKLKEGVIALFASLLTFFITGLGLHFSAAVATGIAPASEEFLSSPGAFAKLAAGGILGLLLLYLAVGVVLAGVVVLLLQYILAHLVVVFWPLAWALRPFGGTARAMGETWIYLYGLLVGLNIAQAVVLRFLFAVPWDASPFGPILGPTVTVVGLAFALIYLPKMFLQKAAHASAVGLGLSAARRADGKHVQEARERVGDGVGRAREWRSDDTDPGVGPGGVPRSGPGVSSAQSQSVRARGAGSVGSTASSASTPADEAGDPSVDVEQERERIDSTMRNKGYE